MDTKPYKAMLSLTPDEHRLLNTLAAITSLTPNRYVESVLRAQLAKDGSSIGLALPGASEAPEIPGQLKLDAAAPKATRRRTAAAVKPTQEKRSTRRTRT